MRIAVIGTGIAGNSSARALASGHQVTVYEKDSRVGGHSHTVVVNDGGVPLSADTGFIVYNELNYPELTALFDHLAVDTVASDMSFSVSLAGGALNGVAAAHPPPRCSTDYSPSVAI